MTRDELIEAILEKRLRIFPKNSTGDDEEYAWLLQHYGVTEEEDNTWLDILSVLYNEESLHDTLGFGPEDEANAEMFEDIQRFLTDDTAVHTFLIQLHQKYQRSQVVYGG